MSGNWKWSKGSRPAKTGARSQPKSNRPRRRSPRLMIQELESRTLLSVTAVLDQGVLDVTLSAANDQALITPSGSSLEVSGTNDSLQVFSNVTSLVVLGANTSSQDAPNQSVALSGSGTIALAAASGADALSISGVTAVSFTDVTINATSGNINVAVSETTSATNPSTSSTFAPQASISVMGATIQADNVTLDANASATDVTNGLLGGVLNSSGVAVAISDLQPSATVTVGGGSSVQVNGTGGNVAIGAVAVATVESTPQVTSSLLPADAVIATSIVNSQAVASVVGGSTVSAGDQGVLGITSTNTTDVTTNVGGSSSAGGVSAAVAIDNSTSQADVAVGSAVSGGTVDVTATTINTADTTATASAQGGGSNSGITSLLAGNIDPTNSNDTASTAKTSGGPLSIAGAVAVTKFMPTTQAYVDSSSVMAANAININAASDNNTSTVADGSAANGSSSVGVGVAVAINDTAASNTATVESTTGTTTLTAPTIMVQATAPTASSSDVHDDSASATAGESGTNVGIAGALALNIISNTTFASVPTGSSVSIGGNGNVSFIAQNSVVESAIALPASGGGTGGKVGVGAAVALNIATNTTQADLGDQAYLFGAGDLALSASSNDTVATEAESGAGPASSSSSGSSTPSVSLSPTAAITVLTNTTVAQVGAPDGFADPLTLGGSFSATATHTGLASTTTSGVAGAGSSASIGASLALAFVTDQTTATTFRSLDAAGGGVTFVADGSAASAVSATASAAGGPTNTQESQAPNTGPAPSGEAASGSDTADPNSVDGQNAQQRSYADSQGTFAGSNGQPVSAGSTKNDAPTPAAKTSDGSVTVAAAVAVNIVVNTAEATIPDGLSITAAGPLTLTAANGTGNAAGTVFGDTATASGVTTGAAKVGVGAALALNLVKLRDRAAIGAGDTISAQSAALSATMHQDAGVPETNTFGAIATAGAGSSDVGVAGALGINLLSASSQATIGESYASSPLTSGAVVTITPGGTGAVTLTAEEDSTTTASAMPATPTGATGSSVGVGVGLGLNIVSNTATAALGDNVSLTGAGAVSLNAASTNTTTATAEAGAAGGVAISPAVAISIANNTTTAQVGANDTTGTGVLTIGSLSVTATHTGSTISTAGGMAAGTKAAIGAAIALNIVGDQTTATTFSSLSAAGPVSFTSDASATSSAVSMASASGGQSDSGNGNGTDTSGNNVDSNNSNQRTYADSQGNSEQSDGVGNSSSSAPTPSASTSDGKVSVAAAVSVNIASSQSDATIPSGLAITSTDGALTVSASNTTAATATSDGNATGTAQVGVGAAVSLNLVNASTEATIQANSAQPTTIDAQGVNVNAGTTGSGTPVNAISASATSGAGGSKVGVAGSVAINIVTNTSQALIQPGVSVVAGGGDVSVTSLNNEADTASALPATASGATGGKVGIGASLGLNIITDTTQAEIQDGAALTDAGNVTVTASSPHTITTTAKNGAAGSTAVGAGIGIVIASDQTTAYIGSDSQTLSASGGITVAVTGSLTVSSEADATAADKGGSVGIGATVIVNVSQVSYLAELNRDATAGGSIRITDQATAFSQAVALASESGAAPPPSSSSGSSSGSNPGGSGGTADQETQNQSSYAHTEGGSNSPNVAPPPSGNSEMSSPSSSATSKSGGSGGQSKLGVAAAVAVNVLTTSTVAEIGNGVAVTAGGALTVGSTAQTQALALADGRATSNKTSIGAAVSLNVANLTNTASIGAQDTISAHGVSVTALMANGKANDFSTQGLGVAIGSQVGVAGSVGINVITVDTQASIGAGAVVDSFGALSVQAANDETLQNIALTLAVGSDAGAGAAVNVNVLNNTTLAFIDSNAQVNAADQAQVMAESSLNPSTDALPNSTADTFTLTSTSSDPVQYQAEVAAYNLLVTTLVSALNSSGPPMNFAAGAGASSGGAGIAGSFIVNVDNQTTQAYINNGASVNAQTGTAGYPAANSDQGVTITATETVTISDWAGAIGAGQDAGVGAALDVSIVSEDAQAYIAPSATVDAAQNVMVESDSNGTYSSITAAVGLSESVGIAGAASVDILSPTTNAYIDQGATVSAGGDLLVQASRQATINTVAGQFAGSGDASVGAAISTVVDTVDTAAYIGSGAQITAHGTSGALAALTGLAPGATTPFSGVAVVAATFQNLQAIVAGGAVSGSVSVAGSVAINVLSDTTLAYVAAGASITATDNSMGNGPGVMVTAADPLTLFSTVGAVSGGGDVGVGAGVDLAFITKNTQAYIATASVTADGNVLVQAVSSENLTSISVVAAIGGYVGVGGSAGAYVLNITTRSFIGNDPTNSTTGATDVQAGGGVLVAASESTVLDLLSGSVAGSGAVSVGVAATVPVITKTTEAFIGAGAQVGALGLGSPIQADNGQFAISYQAYGTGFGTAQPPSNPAGSNSPVSSDPSQRLTMNRIATPETQSVNGLAVTAVNSDSLQGVGATGGAAGAVAVNVGGSAAVLTNQTNAYIGSGAAINAVNMGAAVGQGVLVAAGDDASFLGIAAVAALSGGASVAPGVVVLVANDTTTATIQDGASVAALGDVEVGAHSSGDVLAITASGAGSGGLSVGGAVAYISFNDTTQANIGQYATSGGAGAQVNAGGNVLVDATDNTVAYMVTGAVSVGGSLGFGASVSIVDLTKNTDAFIGNEATVNAQGSTPALAGIIDGNYTSGGGFETLSSFNGVAVQAASSENVTNVAVAGAGGGLAGLAGGVSIELFNSNTQGYIGDNAQVNSARSIDVAAVNQATNFSLGGGVGIGGVGFAGAVDVGLLQNSTQAYIGNNAVAQAQQNVDVFALSNDAVTTYALGVAGGAVGVVGSVSVWSIGVPYSAGYTDGNTSDGTVQSVPISGLTSSSSGAEGQTGAVSTLVGSLPPTSNTQYSGGVVTSDQSGIGGSISGDPIAAAINSTAVPAGTVAFIGSGALVAGSGDISVQAKSQVSYNAIVGGLAGGLVGFGGSVDIVNVQGNTQAYIGSNSQVFGGTVTVNAQLVADNIMGTAFAGTAGLIGIGAQVVDIQDTSTESAGLSNAAQITSAGPVQVTASANRALTALAIGGDFGGVAAGVGVAIANAGGGTSASIGSLSQITQTGTGVGVDVSAASTDVVTAKSYGVSAGYVGATGVFADANSSPNVYASISANAGLTSTGSVQVTAQDMPTVSAKAVGVTVALGVAVGAAISQASAAGNTSSNLGAGVVVSAPSLLISAQRSQDSNGDPTALASSIAGSGGILAGAVATQSQAASSGVVAAYTSNGVTLPYGDVTIMANNQTLQDATSTGVAVGGLLAIGSVQSQAGSSVTTAAELGTVTTANTRTGALTVSATGLDVNNATTIAGSGGLLAGDASVGDTSDNSTVQAGLAGGVIHAGAVQVSALNQSQFTPQVSSVNAALAGASGALASNSDATTADATVADNTVIISTDAVAVTAQNTYTETVNGNTVVAGAGGLLNGTAAESQTTLAGAANVTIGNGVAIDVMTSPNPTDTRGILLSASSLLNSADQVTLTTGGLIQGASVNSSLSASLANTVTVGSGDAFVTNENIEVGTYTTVNANNSSEVSTFGLAAVGSAVATTDVTTNQTVTLGANTNLTAFGNVNLTPGEDTNPLNNNTTVLNGVSSAQGYVRGLIAVPTASATTNLTSNAALTVATGDQIQSGANTTLAADAGAPLATADGTGHGYELGFIPVTNGNSSPVTTTSSNVTMNGTVQAGIYHELNITIPNDGSSGIFSSTVSVNPDGNPFAAFTSSFNPSFLPSAFINANFSQTSAQALDSATSQTAVGAIALGPLYAAGGNVTVNAGLLQGSGTITAFGGPTISITNDSPDYLILSSITIPYLPGGEVVYTGTAGASAAQQAGLTVNQSGPGASPVVNIQQLYDAAVGSSSQGPAVFLTGTVNNLGGQVAVTNPFGSVAEAATIDAAQVNITAPNGALVVSLPGGTFFSGSTPYSDWASFMIWPGGNPSQGTPDANLAVAYAANAVYNPVKAFGTDSTQYASNYVFTLALIGHAGETPVNEPDPAPALASGFSQVFYGVDLPFSGYLGDTAASAAALSPVGEYYTNSNSAGDGYGNDSNYGFFPMVPVEPVSTSSQGPSSAAPTASAIHAAQIVINAAVIDLDGDVTVGQPNAWSLSLPTSLAPDLAAVHALYAEFGLAALGGTVMFPLPSATVASGDSLITAQYDVVSNQIIVSDVSASSGGGSLSLDGAIMSTNQYGNIHVNGGLGQVTIDNQTGVPVVVNNVYTGSNSLAATVQSQVDIIDTNQPAATQQTLYLYQPGGGIEVYQGTAAQTQQQLEQGSPASVLTGATSTSYSPESGLRWQWQLQANLTRQINLSSTSLTATPWIFATPSGETNANNPWFYLDQNGNPTAVVSGVSTPTGQLVVEPGLPFFQESITASTSVALEYTVLYHNGHFGFAPYNPATSDSSGTIDPWTYNYISAATLTLTSSVKADNPIGIDFSGLTQGNVSITSNAPVILAGNIVNPNGDTTISAQGSITQSSSTTVTSNNLSLTAAGGGVGVSSQPLSASLTANGVLNVAAGNQGVYLALNSGALLGQISAGDPTSGYGDVVITAINSLDPVSGEINVVGNNITLDSLIGEVGSATALVQISALGTPLANGGALGGVVNVSSLLDIGLIQTGGPLEAGTIASTGGGDVTIYDLNGPILDASATTSAQTLSSAQIAQVWQNLSLMSPTAVQQQTVAAFDNQVNAQYVGYWQLLNNGSVQNGVFTLNTQAVALFTRLAGAALGLANPSSATPEQVQTYANDQYQSYVAFFDQNLAANWMTEADFQAYNPLFSYVATATQTANLTNNALWTENELRYAIDQVALVPSASVPVGNATPNISGANVTLITEVLGFGSPIGQLGAPTVISLADLTTGNLTSAQIAALAVATAPGDILEQGVNGQGQTVTFAFGQQPAGVTLTGVQVSTTVPLFVSSTGVLSAQASGAIYIQGTSQDLTLGQVISSGLVNISAPHSILSSSSSGPQILALGDVSLLAGTGSLGSAAVPLQVDIAGQLTLAAAAQSVYIQQVGSNDLLVNRVVANGQVQLISAAGIDPVAGSGVNIQGQSLNLLAGGNVGTSATPLEVQLGAGGLGGTIAGDVFIVSPTALAVGDLVSTSGGVDLSGQAGGITLGQITAAGAVTVSAPTGDITNGANTTAAFITAPTVTLSALLGTIGTATSDLMIDTSGSSTSTLLAYGNAGVYIDDVKGDLSLNQVTAPRGDVELVAAGSIVNNADTTDVLGVNVSLTAVAGSIGSVGQDVIVDSSSASGGVLNASGDTGVFITQAVGALNVATVSASTGDVRLTVPEAADNGENLNLTAASSITAGGNVLLQVGSNVNLAPGSVITAGSAVTILGDYAAGASFSPDQATTFNLFGQISGASATVVGNENGDVFNIGRAAAGTPLTVQGTGLNDVYNVGATAPAAGGVLANIQGLLTLAGSGDAVLNLDDTGSASPQSGTLTSTAITGFSMGQGGIVYSGVADLNLNLGTGGATGNTLAISVASGQNLPASTVINGGSAGKDALAASWATDFNGTLSLSGFATSTVAIGGNFNGTLTDANPGYLSSITIGGSLAASGVLQVVSASDPAAPTSPAGLLGDIGTMTVGGSIAGLVRVSGNITTLTVGFANTATSGDVNDVSGQVIVGGALTTASISGNLSGAINETLTIDSLYLGGSETLTGVISAVNTVNPALGNINTLTLGGGLDGALIVSGTLGAFNLGGSLGSLSSITLDNLNSMTIHGDLAGRLNVLGTLKELVVQGGTPGTVTAGQIGTIGVYGGYGPVVGRIVENGVQRLIEATLPSSPFPTTTAPPAPTPAASPVGITFQYFYEGLVSPSVEGLGSSTNLANPQLTASVINATGNTGPDQFDFSLVTYSDTAKFNLARLDSASIPGTNPAGVSGIRDVAVEGDILTNVTAAASSFFPNDANQAGVNLPQDNLAGVAVRDFAPNNSINALSIQAVAFGSITGHDGQIETGAAASGSTAADLLTPSTAIVQAGSTNGTTAETFRVPFADLATQQVGFFMADSGNGHQFDNNNVVLVVQGVSTANSSGTGNIVTPSNVARGAVVALITVAETFNQNNQLQGSVIQNIFLEGDGGSIVTEQTIGGSNDNSHTMASFTPAITSTGPLGDIYVQGDLPNVTAPSIFGSIVPSGSIAAASTIQTTGIRTDPITGAISQVPADLGRVYVETTENGPVLTTTQVVSNGGFAGQLLCGGDLISQVVSNGPTTGTITIQPVAWEPGAGNLGTTFTYPSGTALNLGGFISYGPLAAPTVSAGNNDGTTNVNSPLQGGIITTYGSVIGNITIDGPLFGPIVSAGNNGTVVDVNAPLQGGEITTYGSVIGDVTIGGPLFGPIVLAGNHGSSVNLNAPLQGGLITTDGSVLGNINVGGPMNGPAISAGNSGTVVNVNGGASLSGGSITTTGSVIGDIAIDGPLNGPTISAGNNATVITIDGSVEGGDITTTGSLDGGIMINGLLNGPIVSAGHNGSSVEVDSLVQGGSIITTGSDIGPITIDGGLNAPILSGDVYSGTGNIASLVQGGSVLTGGALGDLTVAGEVTGQIVSIGDVAGTVNVGALGGGVIATSGSINGNVTVNGPLTGEIVSVGAINGNVTIKGPLQSGRIASLGSILGDLTIKGSINRKSAIVSGGSIGDAATGTGLSVGVVNGIVAAVGPINAIKVGDTLNAVFYNQNDTINQAAIDAIFSQGLSSSLSPTDLFDHASMLDLENLGVIVANLESLRVKNGELQTSSSLAAVARPPVARPEASIPSRRSEPFPTARPWMRSSPFLGA